MNETNVPQSREPIKDLQKKLYDARCLLREIDVEYQNKRIDLPRELYGKIVNLLATY